MIRLYFCVCLVLSFVFFGVEIQAQGLSRKIPVRAKKAERPNFSGTWKFDLDKSTKSEFGSAILANIKNFTSLMIVEHKGLVINFIEKEQFELINKPNEPAQYKITKHQYFTDGRGETNLLGIEYETKTKWVGTTLVITTYTYRPTANKAEPVSATSIKLSMDGKTLTKSFKIITSNKREEQEFKEFEAVTSYNRWEN